MRRRFNIGSIAAVVAVSGLGVPMLAEPPAEPVRVGISKTLFDGVDESVINKQMEPFAVSVKKKTGVEGEFGVINGPTAIAQAFKDDKLHVAVLQGIEYGWLKQDYPEIKPLLIAVIDKPILKAVVLVPKDSPAKTIADLKGKTLALSQKSPPFTKTYLERLADGEPAKEFKLTTSDNVEAAIEEVVEGKAAATVVAESAMNIYKTRKPGRFNRLRILEESPDFPAAVVIYRPGKAKEKEVEKFREALLAADDTPEGRQTLTLWRLTGFAEVPKDYEAVVDAIVKKYPRK